MTTLWWIVVVVLVANGAFLAGYVLRSEFELYHRAYDLDFTRKRVGA